MIDVIGYLFLGIFLGLPLGMMCMADIGDSLTMKALDERLARWIRGTDCEIEVE